VKLLPLVALLSACGHARDCRDRPGQCQAERIAWNETLGVWDREAPWPIWRDGACLRRNVRPEDKPGEWFCTFGTFHQDDWTVELVWQESYSHGAYFHELIHAALWHRFANPDGGHYIWPEYWQLEPVGMRKLAEAGL